MILLFEFVTGGGWWSISRSQPPCGSLFREGQLMVQALAADFQREGSRRVVLMRDARLRSPPPAGCQVVTVRSADHESSLLCELSARADWTVLIAPEFDDHLWSRCQAVVRVGGRLLGPDASFVKLAADKLRTNRALRRGGVAVPTCRGLAPGAPLPADFTYPAVVKPRFGAGSLDVRLLDTPQPAPPSRGWTCLEAYCPGIPASAALICGEGYAAVLPGCHQRLSADGRFRYLGTALLLDAGLQRRVHFLTRGVAAALPATTGYLGVDLVLGPAADGHRDCVIEVNPRMTTSYVALREACRGNLGASMIAVREGRDFELSFRKERVEFTV